MPWYIPIITMILGSLAGWAIRAHFDNKASRESLKKEVFRDYMTLTDDGMFRPGALLRAGSLRLSKGEFTDVMGDIAKTGRSPLDDSGDHDFIDRLGLFEVLHLVASQKQEVHSLDDIYNCLDPVFENRYPRSLR